MSPQQEQWWLCCPIEIRAFDGTIIRFEVTHVRPVDVAGLDIDDNAVGKSPALSDDGLQIGAVGVCGQDAATAPRSRKKSRPESDLAATLCGPWFESS